MFKKWLKSAASAFGMSAGENTYAPEITTEDVTKGDSSKPVSTTGDAPKRKPSGKKTSAKAPAKTRVPFRKSKDSISVRVDGKQYTLDASQTAFKMLLEEIYKDEHDVDAIRACVNLRDVISQVTVGSVEVDEDTVIFDGRPVSGYIADQILRFMEKGEDITPYARFLNRAKKNPSFDAVDDLFRFLEHQKMPLLPDGRFLAFKHVRGDFKDCHSGTFDNRPGQRPRMAREDCDHNRDRTCSTGLHVCGPRYLGSFYGYRVVAVACAPEDVASVPTDYNNSKMRMVGYEVIRECSTLEVMTMKFDLLVDYTAPKIEDKDHDTVARDTENLNTGGSCVPKAAVYRLVESLGSESVADIFNADEENLNKWLGVAGMFLETNFDDEASEVITSGEDGSMLTMALDARIRHFSPGEKEHADLSLMITGVPEWTCPALDVVEEDDDTVEGSEDSYADDVDEEVPSEETLQKFGDVEEPETEATSSELVFTRGDRSWTASEITALLAEHGQRGTTTNTGIPRSTLQGWLKQIKG